MWGRNFYLSILGSCLSTLLLLLGLSGGAAQATTKPATSLTQLQRDVFIPTEQINKKTNKPATIKGKATRTIASGNFGATWTIDDAGTLHIQAGTLKDNNTVNSNNVLVSPWYMYAKQIKLISFDGPVIAAAKSRNLFDNLYNVTNIQNMNNFTTSQATDMSYMFYNCTSLLSLDVSNFDTSNVTNISGMFGSCISLPNLNVSNFDTSKVTNMSYTFFRLMILSDLDVSNFDTSKVTNMSYMFASSHGLASLDVSNFDTSMVTDMSYMFAYCPLLASLNLYSFDTHKVTDKSNMLFEMPALNALTLGNNINISITSLSDPVAPYAGYLWQLDKTSPNPLYTSAGLMAKYDGSKPGTYYLIKMPLQVHDSVITKGSTWNPADNFDSFNGNPSWAAAQSAGFTTSIKNPAGQTVDQLDTNVLGQYQVTYIYTVDDGTTRSATVSVNVLPAAGLTVPANWDFGEVDTPGSATMPVKTATDASNTPLKNNNIVITNPANGATSGWTLNVKYDNFTAPAQPNLTNTKLQMDNLELDDNAGNKVSNGTVSDSLTLFAGTDYAKLAGVSNPPSSNKGTWNLQLGRSLSDINLIIPNKPTTTGSKPVQYHSTISWQLLNSVS